MTPQLDHFADLCMIAQGFRPSQARLVALCDQGMVWHQPGRPSRSGLTILGKSQLLDMLAACCGEGVEGALASSRALRPDNAAFSSGMAYLDEFECNLRLGVRPGIPPHRLAFLAWLIKEQPGSP